MRGDIKNARNYADNQLIPYEKGDDKPTIVKKILDWWEYGSKKNPDDDNITTP